MDGQLRTGLTAFACTDLLHGGATVSLVGIVGTSMRQEAEQLRRCRADSWGGPRAVLKFHLCVRRSGVLILNSKLCL